MQRAYWLIPWLGYIGLAYGTYEMVATYGWGAGLILAVASTLLGVMAVNMLWPLWMTTDDPNKS